MSVRMRNDGIDSCRMVQYFTVYAVDKAPKMELH